MTNAIRNEESKFLAGVPLEIRHILDWYSTAPVMGDGGSSSVEFANKFLGWLIEDHALILQLGISPAAVLALVLQHHQKSPLRENAVEPKNAAY